MPKRNRIKIYGSEQYYHLYNRGVNRQDIFHEPEDYFYFLGLFKRHLSEEAVTDSSGRPFAKFNDEVELVAFCLMPNHFHLLCYLKESEGIVRLMRSVMTAYTMYFNKKYQRTGGLYEGPFLASRIENETYLWHVSRYIHLNPLDIGQGFRHYPYSSIAYFAGEKRADWLHINNLVDTDKDAREYLEFVADYETMHQDLKYLKNILAA
ncbi:transposase [Candidatus Saccharibacteria bacterium]|nr:transposase [Candidatus Saccharibacteria bacterium]